MKCKGRQFICLYVVNIISAILVDVNLKMKQKEEPAMI